MITKTSSCLFLFSFPFNMYCTTAKKTQLNSSHRMYMGLKQSQSMNDLFFFYTIIIIWIIL